MTEETKRAESGKAASPLCVICNLRPQTEKYRPFCSKRCADVDLHRWLGGIYAIPGKEDELPAGQIGDGGSGA